MAFGINLSLTLIPNSRLSFSPLFVSFHRKVRWHLNRSCTTTSASTSPDHTSWHLLEMWVSLFLFLILCILHQHLTLVADEFFSSSFLFVGNFLLFMEMELGREERGRDNSSFSLSCNQWHFHCLLHLSHGKRVVISSKEPNIRIKTQLTTFSLSLEDISSSSKIKSRNPTFQVCAPIM